MALHPKFPKSPYAILDPDIRWFTIPMAFCILERNPIVVEKANGNYSAYAPDLPGCIATGATSEETEQNMEAIEMHVQGLKEDKLPIPESSSFAEYVIVK